MVFDRKKELVLSLIRDDLVSRKLVLALRRAGINADDYITGISTSVFSLMGISDTDEEMFDTYTDFADLAEHVSIERGVDALNPLVHHIYGHLLARTVSSGQIPESGEA